MIDVNAKSKNEWTPLHLAAKEGHNVIVERLIKHSAGVKTVNAKTKEEKTPLHLAAQNGHSLTIECLLNNGAY